ncbi:hypothetical protein N8194_04165, partial [Akkermansiaceae bacterium]|nr:hypothetical protein [Akkermansiaceae bacterium]
IESRASPSSSLHPSQELHVPIRSRDRGGDEPTPFAAELFGDEGLDLIDRFLVTRLIAHNPAFSHFAFRQLINEINDSEIES